MLSCSRPSPGGEGYFFPLSSSPCGAQSPPPFFFLRGEVPPPPECLSLPLGVSLEMGNKILPPTALPFKKGGFPQRPPPLVGGIFPQTPQIPPPLRGFSPKGFNPPRRPGGGEFWGEIYFTNFTILGPPWGGVPETPGIFSKNPKFQTGNLQPLGEPYSLGVGTAPSFLGMAFAGKL